MQVLIQDEEVVTYPYTIGKLRRDNPNTSFPKNPPDDLLASWGVMRVLQADRPQVSYTQNVIEGIPALSEGVWTQVWTIKNATDDEITERTNVAATENRNKRNSLLRQTDYLALSDNTLSAEMVTYRQALRDMTSHSNWPHLEETDWPVAPGAG